MKLYQRTEAFKDWRETLNNLSLRLARALERLRHPYEPARHYMRGRPSDRPPAKAAGIDHEPRRPAH